MGRIGEKAAREAGAAAEAERMKKVCSNCGKVESGGANVNKVVGGLGLTADTRELLGNVTPHCAALGKDYLEIVKYLVRKGANVDKAKQDDGVTPLFLACQEGRLSVVKCLVVE